MSLLIFGRSHPFPQIWWVLIGFVIVSLALVLFYAINDDFSFKRFFEKKHEQFWAVLSLGVLSFFVWAAFDPFLPSKIMGLQYWPIRLTQSDLWIRLLLLASLGAGSFLVASDEGLAGGFWGWKPILGPGVKRPLVFGATVGAAFALFGVYANRGLFLAEALTRIGYRDLGSLLVFGLPVLWLLCCVAIVALPVYGWVHGSSQKLILGAGLATAWVIPIELGDAYLRLEWHFGPVSLQGATHLAPATEAPSAGIMILADRDGSPGNQYREDILASRGVSLDQASLLKLEDYLEKKKYRTLFYEEAIMAIRRGWMLHWRPGKHLEATAIHYGKRFPPDYVGFLSAIRVAPATLKNRDRLDRMAGFASEGGFHQVKTAQKMFEGFSAAYARYGDLEISNAWLNKIRGLWPLFEDNIHIEPIEDNFDGWIGGRLLFNGKPASGVRVGLFALPSTTTVLGAYTGLVSAEFPDKNGRFEFTDLTTGRYYLALRADPVVLGGDGLTVRNAPGTITLRFGEMTEALLPIEIEKGEFKASRPLPRKPPLKVPLKSLPGIGISR